MTTPTDEQLRFIELANTGKNLVGQAGAGTGKSTTLKLASEARPKKKTLYIVFNKALQLEAEQKFPSHVRCSTAHSLAFRTHGAPMKHRLNSPKLPGWKIAKQLGILPQDIGEHELREQFLGSLVRDAVRRFCLSADPEISGKHVQWQLGLSADADENKAANYALRDWATPYLRRAWEDLCSERGQLPFDHNTYLKQFQLDEPTLSYDVILFDEAQDANPVMEDIVARQTRSQLVVVGDSNQQIYEWNGAVDALARFEAAGANVSYLSQSFRFGEAVAQAANQVLALLDSKLRLRGFESIPSVIGALPRANGTTLLCRTNMGVANAALGAYSGGQRFSVVGGTEDLVSFCRSALALQEGGRPEHRDLVHFASWDGVVAAVESDPFFDQDVAARVRAVEKFGAEYLIPALSADVDERRADIIISTAHKAKGREWDHVALAGDFIRHDKEGRPKPLTTEELRLLYVAVTRAKLVLDPGTVLADATGAGVV